MRIPSFVLVEVLQIWVVREVFVHHYHVQCFSEVIYEGSLTDTNITIYHYNFGHNTLKQHFFKSLLKLAVICYVISCDLLLN